MRFTVCGHTGKGPRHEENEDVILLNHGIVVSGTAEWRIGPDDAQIGLLVAVADGMGSHAVGGMAARIMLKQLEESFSQQAENADIRMLVNVLYSAAKEANRAVLEYAEKNPEFAGMGCTLAGVILLGNEYVAFNAGDSRVYRYSQGVLRQLTDDDTLVAMAVRKGRMTPAEAKASSGRHYVTNATGSRSFRLHVGECLILDEGDSLLLCSDGLHGVVRLSRMERLLTAVSGAAERCTALAQAAEVRGGYDDLSVVIINVEPAEDTEA